jgi:hypothetical protein
LKLLNDASVALFCASPQLFAVGPHRLQYLYSISLLCIDRADHLPMSQYIFLYVPSSAAWHPASCPGISLRLPLKLPD